MSAQELEEYPKSGKLPSWFPVAPVATSETVSETERMFKRLKKLKDDFVSVATNSAAPGDYQLGSVESRAAARALIEQ
jgi:5,10-methylenetetrahydrofolate reductase